MSTPPPPSPGPVADGHDVEAAVEVLRRGGLVAFPTETVYGLGANAADPDAVAKVFAAKGRPADHPLIVHLADAAQLDEWATDVPDVARRVAEHFWPGPLTLILRRHPDVPTAVTGGQDTIGLRVPRHPVAHTLLAAFGGGVAAPSANRFGRVSPTTRAHVLSELGDDVDVVLEGGACEVGLESTILDLSGEHPRLLRPGAIGAEALAAVLGDAPTRTVRGGPRTPGRLPSHYAPTVPVRVVDGAVLARAVSAVAGGGRRVAVLSHSRTTVDGAAHVLPMPADAEGYGRDLYRRLGALDALGCDLALVERPPAQEGWEAVHDRLGRAEGVDPHAPRALLVVDHVSRLSSAADADAEPARALASDGTAPAIVLAAWVADEDDLSAWAGRAVVGAATERPLHLGEAYRGDGWVLRRLEASDANRGIPVTRTELFEALRADGGDPRAFRVVLPVTADPDLAHAEADVLHAAGAAALVLRQEPATGRLA